VKIHNVVQGSPEWHALRARCLCASEAAAMIGESKKMRRDELLRLKHTGDEKEFSDWVKENLFDKGHEVEEKARAIIEARIGEELYPATVTDDAERLLASLDGMNMEGVTGFECKLWNAELAAAVRAQELPPAYYWQLEQQLLVACLEKIIFCVSDGTPENTLTMEYRAVPGRAEKLLAGWAQFEADLKDYKPVEVLPPVTAEPVMALPALSIQVDGQIALRSNLDLFGARLAAFIDGIDKAPTDDQGFANAEAAVKTLQTAQDALEAAESSALAQTASIDELRRTVAHFVSLAKTTRLNLEKLVRAQKEKVREDIRKSGIDALAAHVAALNERLGKPYMPAIPADFAGAMKGKKTIASLRDAVNTTLANAKVEATQIAARIQANLATLTELASDHKHLFADAAQLVLKANDDLTAIIKARIAEAREAEQKRLDAERERIRQEEEVKARAAAAPQAPAQTAGPAPIAAAPKPKVAVAAKGPRPIDDDIIAVLAQHYRVHNGIVIDWLRAMDLQAAAARHAEQLMSA
jgi:putative phage-type endonuclease